MSDTSEIVEILTENDRPQFSIGVVAEMIGVSVHALRTYETAGLVYPFHTNSTRRMYSENDISRLRNIRIMIEDRGLNFAGIKALMSLAPCWDIKNCTASERAICPAFKDTVEPCWLIENKPHFCSEEECKECQVYKELTLSSNMKQYLQSHGKTV